MLRLGHSTPYVKLSIYLSLAVAFVAILSGRYEDRLSATEDESIAWTDEVNFIPQAEIFDAYGDDYTDACYTVEIDPDLLDGIETYRSGQLQQQTYPLQELATEAFQLKLAERLGDRSWNDAKLCDKGSFVLIFQVNAEGRLGSDMLAHHIKGLNRGASLATRVLMDLDAEGHRWHDGTGPVGQVQLPVRYVLN